MISTIPYIALVLLFLAACTYVRNLRCALMYALIIWSAIICGSTELLSLVRGLCAASCIITWALVSVICCYVLVTRRHELLHRRIYGWPEVMTIFFAVCIAIVSILTLIIAFNSPSHITDALRYHLPRVSYWAQNGTVGNFPTHDLRQLYNGPMPGYMVMQSLLLRCGDAQTNMPQWLAMLGCIIASSLIAKEFGGNEKSQTLAAVVCATIPMGILQSSTGLVDYVTAFFFVAFVYYMICWTKSNTWTSCIFTGLALGMALLSKHTAYIFAVPFILWPPIAFLKTRRARCFIQVLCIGLLVLLVNTGFYMRNIDLSENPLGPRDVVSVRNTVFTPKGLASNVTRNLGTHLGLPYNVWNDFWNHALTEFHKWLGISINDHRTTGWKRFSVYYARDVEHAGSPIHLFLAIISLLAIPFFPSLRRNPLFLLYLLSITVAFTLYCFLIKWCMESCRYDLPIIVLLAPVIGLVIGAVPLFRYGVGCALFLYSSQFFVQQFHVPGRPECNIFTTDRTEQYFSGNTWLKTPYITVARTLGKMKVRNIGLAMPYNTFEYPFWAMLYTFMETNFYVINLNPVLSTRKYGFSQRVKSFPPDCIVTVDQTRFSLPTDYTGSYVHVYSDGAVHVYTSPVNAQRFQDALHTYQRVKNHCFRSGLDNWHFWNKARNNTNTIDIVSAGSIYGMPGTYKSARISNPRAELVGISQVISVSSGEVYRLSARVKSLMCHDPSILFGGRIGFWLPPQKERSIVWMSEHNKWWRKAITFTNHVTGNATLYVHMGYGGVSSTGDFTDIRLEKLSCDH